MDMMNPKAAAERRFVQQVTRCYSAANPSKLGEVEKIVEKYKGREGRLLAQLRDKYEKFPECNL